MIGFHARSGLNIVDQSKRLYSCRYHMPLMSFCTIHLGHALINQSTSQPPAAQTLEYCLDVLQQGRSGFDICGPLQHMFCETAKNLDIPLPEDIEERIGPVNRYSVDDLLDACTRLSYVQPTDEIVRYIDSRIGRDWLDDWRRSQSQSPGQSTSGKYLQINSILND